MSAFPLRGDVAATRVWLDKAGFTGKLVGWSADALLGTDKADVLRLLESETEGLRLWGLLTTARRGRGKIYLRFTLLNGFSYLLAFS